MYDSPSSLQDVCVDYICDHLADLCEAITNDISDGKASTKHILLLDKTRAIDRLVFKNDVQFPSGLSDYLLKTISLKGKLTDLEMSLFDVDTAYLRRVMLPDCSKLTTNGLRTLKSHKIQELEACNLLVTVNDLISCLGDWTLRNLRSLNVAHSTFLNESNFCVVVGLSKLQALQSLDVSNTEFSSHGLDIVVEDLPQLEHLNISCTKVDNITPLRKIKRRLKSLYMYDLRLEEKEEVLCDLESLRFLDISEGRETRQLETFITNMTSIKASISKLIKKPDIFPDLRGIDFSGVFDGKDEFERKHLRDFVKRHPKLEFLGLVQTDACSDVCFVNPKDVNYRTNLMVTGTESESQILLGLKCYLQKPWFIQKCLFNLFKLTPHFQQPRVDIIKTILPGMELHIDSFGVQMAATACLYNLTKNDMANKIHPNVLARIVDLTLVSMETYPDHFQLQKNSLLTLCSDRILQEVPIDRYKCARLVLECLCTFDDASMSRMSVAICSILAAKISTDETSMLGAEPRYMRKLLNLVRMKMLSDSIDITMKFTLSALWNLTDESPTTCNVFLNEGGLKLFIDVLTIFFGEPTIETKVLGLINNIAEVPELRHELLNKVFINILRQLLQSDFIDVSYFAAGIMSHLASEPLSSWEDSGFKRNEILEELGNVVSNWKTPNNEMVAYRSFLPFIPLLNCSDAPQVQLWAVWAIRHVCTKNAERYCPMLEEGKGSFLLRSMLDNPNTDSRVKEICKDIIDLIR